MRKSIYKLSLSAMFSLYLTCIFAGRIYVSQQNITGFFDGQSWSTAFPELTQALEIAEYGDSVWVAQGNYYPTSGTDRTAAFEVKTGVQVYGGFEGWEVSFSQRSWISNATILNGDIGEIENQSDNAYHVLRLLNPDEQTIIDGVRVFNGNADGSEGDRQLGGGLLVSTNQGNAADSKVIIRHCIISNCRAVFGGAIAFDSPSGLGLTPYIYRCVFASNEAVASGGALFRSADNGMADTVYIRRSTFQNNIAGLSGGAIEWSNLHQTMVIEHSGFYSNECYPGGGAMTVLNVEKNAKLFIKNCSFELNTSSEGGGLLFQSNPILADTVSLSIDACSFSRNMGGGVSCLILGSSYTELRAEHSVFADNERTGTGAGIYIEKDENQTSSCSFYNNLFTGNSGSSAVGGAVRIRGRSFSAHQSYNTFANCVFAQNTGAAAITNGNSEYTVSSFVNCTFYENGSYDLFKNWSPNFDEAEGFLNRAYVYNCIFQKESASSMREHLLNNVPESEEANLYEYSISHSAVSALDCDLPGGEEACGQSILYDASVEMLNADLGDYRLVPCSSPAKDAGLDSIIQALDIITDLAGEPRISGAGVDMGALEAKIVEISLDSLFAPSCPDQFNGGFSVSLSGIPPFEQELTALSIGFVINAEVDELISGDYQLVVIDSSSCSDTLLVSVPGVDSLIVEAVITHATPDEGGIISVSNVLNGIPPFQFNWSNGDTSSMLTGLSPGFYTLTVTDSINCTSTFVYEIDLSNELSSPINNIQCELFPNPASVSLSLSVKGLPQRAGRPEFLLYSPIGEMILRRNLEAVGGEANDDLDISAYNEGVYFWVLQQDGQLLKRGKLFIVN